MGGCPTDKTEIAYVSISSLFAEMVMDEAMRKYHKERLYKEIDQSLMERNQVSFYALTNEFKLYN